MRFVKPIIGQWYLSRDTDRMFEVVSIDEPSGAVEIQDYDGDLDEIAAEDWFALDVAAIEPPEDLAGAFDPDEENYNGYANERGDREIYDGFFGLRAEWQPEGDSLDS